LDDQEQTQYSGISDSIAALAQLTFDQVAPTRGDGGVLDGVAAGLNLLAEELKDRVQDRERVTGVLDAIRDAVVVISDTGRMTYLNKAARQLLGHGDANLVDRQLQEHLILPDSASERGEELLPVGNEPQPSIRRLLRHPDRNPTPVIVSTAPLNGVGRTTSTGHVCVLFGQYIARDHRRWLAGTSETLVPFSVRTLLEEVIAFHSASAGKLGVDLQLGACPGLPLWVFGPRSPIQNVLHALADAAMQWTQKGVVKIAVTSVTAPALSRVVLRFRVDNEDGAQIDESLRRRLFETETDADTPPEMDPQPENISIRTAAIVAESMGGQLGLHRGHNGEFVARLWIDLAIAST